MWSNSCPVSNTLIIYFNNNFSKYHFKNYYYLCLPPPHKKKIKKLSLFPTTRPILLFFPVDPKVFFCTVIKIKFPELLFSRILVFFYLLQVGIYIYNIVVAGYLCTFDFVDIILKQALYMNQRELT